ncbi:MAG: short-chain dehydrogenase, partial [Arthrobacter sp.]|nr:short-chain dehydrogenase [Arthrobacter sp.]
MTHTTTFPAARTAVLTGAASERGIGRATADRLAREGWNIAILDIDGEAAALAAKEIGEKHGVQALGLQTDVSDEASIDAAISRVEAELPPIVALANIAGISSPRPFMEETKEGWERVFAINMTGTFLVTQRVLGGMIDRKLGRVVSIS